MIKRYFGNELAGDNELSPARQFQKAAELGVNLVGAFIISDFVPYLKFLVKFQGWEAKLLLLRALTTNICCDMIQFEERRRRLKEKAASNEDDQKHQDMVDVMLSSEVDGEEPFTDQDIVWNVMVINYHTPIFCLINSIATLGCHELFPSEVRLFLHHLKLNFSSNELQSMISHFIKRNNMLGKRALR